ncbi:MAG: FMN-binding protein [Planctomycetes bacterium]|nr:FMN-binding protein [Planctomycetota bacterium]
MTAPAVTAPAPTPVWHLYRALVGIGLLCGLLIVSVYVLTRPIIQANRIAARQAAVLEVLPAATRSRTFRLADDETFAPVAVDSLGEGLVFAGFDADGRLVGVALEAAGQGYADVVRVLYGYSFDQQAVIGIKLLESRETPGLGDRVESDTGYQANFERLDVALTADGSALQHPIEFTKNGGKQHPWQIDGITGATITSRAIADMLAASTAHWIARVVRRSADFRPEN